MGVEGSVVVEEEEGIRGRLRYSGIGNEYKQKAWEIVR